MNPTVATAIAIVLALAAPAAHRTAVAPPLKAAPAVADGRQVVVLDRPVRVTATLRPGSSKAPIDAFAIVVAYGAERCTLTTLLVRRRDSTSVAPIDAIRHSIGWRGGYLFVRTECGGGNGWKCTSESVFMLRNGRLAGLGTLAARTEAADLATSWRNGMFWDEDADLQSNALTSHVAAPRFEIRLRERNGRLIADADSTWAANSVDYAWREGVARENANPPAGKAKWEDAIAPRLGNAALAKYCGRSAQLAAILAETRALLPPGLFATFEAELAKIEPGALPRTSAPARIQAAR